MRVEETVDKILKKPVSRRDLLFKHVPRAAAVLGGGLVLARSVGAQKQEFVSETHRMQTGEVKENGSLGIPTLTPERVYPCVSDDCGEVGGVCVKTNKRSGTCRDRVYR